MTSPTGTFESLPRAFDHGQVILFRRRAEAGWPVEAVSSGVARLGYTPAEFLAGGLRYGQLIVPEDLARVAAGVAEHAARGADWFQQSYRVRARDGSTRWVDDRTVVVRDAAGQVTHYESTILDTTEHQALLEELIRGQRMESLGRLAGGVAHDFNNLLTVIHGHAAILKEALGAEQGTGQHVDRIVAAAERAAAMTRQLLSFTRRQPDQAGPFDASLLVTEVVALLRPLLGERFQLVIEPCPEPCPVGMERGQLEQVVLSLVLNARDAIPDRGTVTIGTRALAAAGCVELLVRDDGLGLDATALARIFDAFARPKGPGRAPGMGLAAARVAVERAGGRITVHSLPGRGAEFVVRLPRAH
jgi:PAS domain S-box-containing protein